MGCPMNVPAGHSSAAVEQAIAKYRNEALQEEQEKLRQMEAGELPREETGLQAFQRRVPEIGRFFGGSDEKN